MAALDNVPRTAVNQAPGGGTDYPFTTPCDLEGAVLDFYLSYPDPGCAHPLPFTLTVSGDAVTVTDAAGGTVAAGSFSAVTPRAWGTRSVYEWVADPTVMRVVVTGTPDGSGTLDARTCDRLAARVTAFRVGLVRLTGNVKFEAGYNIDLSGADAVEPVDGGRYRTTVNLDAVPGAGAGRLSGCEETTPQVRRINQVGPDCSGNFKIEVDPCFRIGPPLLVTGGLGEPRTAEFAADGLTAEEAAHALRITSDCHDCCQCDYYVRTYRGLKRMWERWRTIAATAEAARDTYEGNRERWLLAKQCRIDHAARLVMSTDFNCKLFVGGSFCNFTSCCLTGVELRFTFRRYTSGTVSSWNSASANEAYISGSPTDGDERYSPQAYGNGRVLRFFLDYADPQAMSVGKMKACVNGCAADQSLEAALTVHAPQPPTNPHNGDPCVLPTPEVPAWVLATWADAAVPDGDPVRAVVVRAAGLNPTAPRFECGC